MPVHSLRFRYSHFFAGAWFAAFALNSPLVAAQNDPPDMDPMPQLCDLTPFDSRLANFYATFEVEEVVNLDLVGDGLPTAFAVALIEHLCDSDDAILAAAAQAAFLSNRASLRPLVGMETVLGGNVAMLSTLAMVSEGMGDLLIQWLDDAGINVSNVVFTPVACIGFNCLPQTADSKDAFSVYGSGVNHVFSATGDFDGDGFSNATEAANVLADGGSVEEFVLAATDPAIPGGTPPGGCAAGGSGNGPRTGAAPLILCVSALVLAGHRRSEMETRS